MTSNDISTLWTRGMIGFFKHRNQPQQKNRYRKKQAIEYPPEDLLQKAADFLNEFVTPIPDLNKTDEDENFDEPGSTKDHLLVEKRTSSLCQFRSKYPNPTNDKTNQNIRLLTRDLLYLREAITAI
ncbi:hypothetical protein BDQ17DRAFT_1434512 [Cyathus striatus]|nr:hypothetical protein BDQ17DRAFT_1434512 [Cyathus striatus]